MPSYIITNSVLPEILSQDSSYKHFKMYSKSHFMSSFWWQGQKDYNSPKITNAK